MQENKALPPARALQDRLATVLAQADQLRARCAAGSVALARADEGAAKLQARLAGRLPSRSPLSHTPPEQPDSLASAPLPPSYCMACLRTGHSMVVVY